MRMINARESVAWFAEEMERQLRANDHKPGWAATPVSALMMRLLNEAGELAKAVLELDLGLGTRAGVIREAADVANFAMMVAEVVSGRAIPGCAEAGCARHADPVGDGRHCAIHSKT